MLNPFPDLLILGLLAPFVLRLALGGLFLWSARQHLLPEMHERIGVAFRGAAWNIFGARIAWYYAAAEVIIGTMFILGFLMQIAALLGIVAALKSMLFRKRYPVLAEQSIAHHTLVIAVCVSLMLSGAGAIAIDLPL